MVETVHEETDHPFVLVAADLSLCSSAVRAYQLQHAATALVDADEDRMLVVHVPAYGRFTDSQLNSIDAFWEARATPKKGKGVMDWVLVTKFDTDGVSPPSLEMCNPNKVRTDFDEYGGRYAGL